MELAKINTAKTSLKFLLPVGFTCLLVIAGLYLVDLGALLDFFAKAKLSCLMLAFFFYSLSIVLRSLRWQVFDLERRVSFFSMFYVTCIHNNVNILVPARIGELSYPVLLKKLHGVNLADSLITILIVRLMDICVLCLSLSTAVALMSRSNFLSPLFLVSAILALVFLIFFLLFSPALSLLIKLITTLDVAFLKKRFEKIVEFPVLVEKLTTKKRIFAGLFYTLVSTVSRYLFYWFLVLAPGLDVGFLKSILASIFAEASWSLPIQTFAGIGSMEVGWVLGFTMVGLDKNLGLSSAVYVHALLLVFSIFWAALSFFVLSLKHHKDQNERKAECTVS